MKSGGAVVVLASILLLTGCGLISSDPVPTITPALAPDIRIHYLGHSSFLFQFGDETSVLTDYGQSNAYGVASPIEGLAGFIPDIVLYSHHEADHDRGETFAGAQVFDQMSMTSLIFQGLTIDAIPTKENSPGDNVAFVMIYREFTIVFLSDSQGMITTMYEDERQAFISLLPDQIDLLFIPVGWVREIASPAADFVKLLDPKAVIPMHYWSVPQKEDFIRILASDGALYQELQGADYEVFIPEYKAMTPMRVISLEPSPYSPSAGE